MSWGTNVSETTGLLAVGSVVPLEVRVRSMVPPKRLSPPICPEKWAPSDSKNLKNKLWENADLNSFLPY